VCYHNPSECPKCEIFPPNSDGTKVAKPAMLFCVTSNFSSENTEKASECNLSSHASTSGKVVVVNSISVATLIHEEVSECSIKDLMQDWMDQTKQSHCSKTTKEKDLERIQYLEEALELKLVHSWLNNPGPMQSRDRYLWDIKRACMWERAEADDMLLSKFLVKENILYKKYTQKDSTAEKHVICLPDVLLPAIIHLLHVKNAHPALTANRRIFEHYYYNRNASRMLKSYIKACTLCAKRPAK
jgi:hypothetical protein